MASSFACSIPFSVNVLQAQLERGDTATNQKSPDTRSLRQSGRLRSVLLGRPGAAVARRVIDREFPSGLGPRRPPAACSRGGLQGAPSREGVGHSCSRDRPGGAFTPLHLSIRIAPAVAAPGPPPLEAGADQPRRRHRRRLGVPAPGPSCGRHEAAGPASEADLAAGDAPSGANAGAAARAPEAGPAAHLGVQVRERRGRARRVGEERRVARARPELSREAGRQAGRRGASGPAL